MQEQTTFNKSNNQKTVFYKVGSNPPLLESNLDETIEEPTVLQSNVFKADAAITPSGPPPVPMNISTPNFLLVTNNAPNTSPSEIYLIFTFNLFNSEISWRKDANKNLLPELMKYNLVIKNNIGLRRQSKLTKEQAKFVAKCNSIHRDVSLNF